MKVFKILINLIVSSLFFVSCTASKKVGNNEVTFEEILEINKSNFEKIVSYSASGKIELKLKSLRTDLQFLISTIKPNQVLIDLYGFFGIDVGTIYLNNDSIFIYNALNEQMILTSFSSTKFKELNSLGLDKNFFYALIYAFIDQEQLPADSSTLNNKEDKFELIKFFKDKRVEFVYDKFSKGLNQIKVFDELGEPMFEVNFRSTKDYDSIVFPTKIEFINLKSSESISLSFKEIKFNQESEIDFQLPENVEILKW
ncbi:MAG: DUF4292 domain-containing protein [Ignavibacteria bacterium]|nr:DUF4292 domain-containing protein [Ignavibacteria bacterium]